MHKEGKEGQSRLKGASENLRGGRKQGGMKIPRFLELLPLEAPSDRESNITTSHIKPFFPMNHVYLYFCFTSKQSSHILRNSHELRGSKIEIVFKHYIFVTGKCNDE